MAITYPLTPPSSSWKSVALQPIQATGEVVSPFTFKRKTFEALGETLQATISLPPMTEGDAREWMAFFTSLRGPFGTFYLEPKIGDLISGGATFDVQGAGQTGRTLSVVDVNGGTLPPQAGEYIAIEDVLYLVLSVSGSNPFYNVDVFPRILTAPPNGETLVRRTAIPTDPRGIFSLTQTPEYRFPQMREIMDGLTFTARQVV